MYNLRRFNVKTCGTMAVKTRKIIKCTVCTYNDMPSIFPKCFKKKNKKNMLKISKRENLDEILKGVLHVLVFSLAEIVKCLWYNHLHQYYCISVFQRV